MRKVLFVGLLLLLPVAALPAQDDGKAPAKTEVKGGTKDEPRPTIVRDASGNQAQLVFVVGYNMNWTDLILKIMIVGLLAVNALILLWLRVDLVGQKQESSS
ncbi:MAG: hypothetical protein KatS3mg105_4132 [Gemmatales bacterium]|nr:MAG: hypothetical protein KatS3mg105_4132 [Gemmatales bacterium]